MSNDTPEQLETVKLKPCPFCGLAPQSKPTERNGMLYKCPDSFCPCSSLFVSPGIWNRRAGDHVVDANELIEKKDPEHLEKVLQVYGWTIPMIREAIDYAKTHNTDHLIAELQAARGEVEKRDKTIEERGYAFQDAQRKALIERDEAREQLKRERRRAEVLIPAIQNAIKGLSATIHNYRTIVDGKPNCVIDDYDRYGWIGDKKMLEKALAEAERLLLVPGSAEAQKLECKHTGETWFDRTIELGPNGEEDGMHTRCSDCGKALD